MLVLYNPHFLPHSYPNVGSFLNRTHPQKGNLAISSEKKSTSVAQRGNAVTTAVPISALLIKSQDHLSPLYFTVPLT